jgi:hypothetical protein
MTRHIVNVKRRKQCKQKDLLFNLVSDLTREGYDDVLLWFSEAAKKKQTRRNVASFRKETSNVSLYYNNWDGAAPFHMLCRQCPLTEQFRKYAEVIRVYIQAVPDILHITNTDGELPISLLFDFVNSLFIPRVGHWDNPYYEHNNTILILGLFIDKYTQNEVDRMLNKVIRPTEWLNHLDGNRRHLLHSICEQVTSLTIMKYVFHNGEYLNMRDKYGNTPTDLLKISGLAAKCDNDGRVMLHHLFRGTYYTETFFDLLYFASPKAVTLRDNFGMTPFDYMSLNEELLIENIFHASLLCPQFILDYNNNKRSGDSSVDNV